jgi:hypothetical protein
VSELDVSLLVRRTRLLLRFYPPAYRAHRGEEILDTLLETTRPGRGWPPAREVASVIGGGLRARRAANLNQGLRVSLRHAGILAAAMVMVQTPTALLGAVGQHIAHPSRPYGLPADMDSGLVLGSLLVVMALAATWCGRRWLVAAAVIAAVIAAVPAAVACFRAIGVWGFIVAEMAVPTVLALTVLLPLTKRAERPPISLLWLPCLLLAVNFVAGLAVGSGLNIRDAFPVPTLSSVVLLAPYNTYLSLVPVLVAACWLATDVRPLAAVALQFLLWRVFYAVFGAYPAENWTQMAIVVGLSLALTCALVWLLRHRTRTVPPTIG